MINKHLKNIAKNLKIEKNLSTYSTRHSFATVLKRFGVNTSFISDALGHSNIKTAERYLDGFEN
ncbi:MAG: tyrosine-type recombinase/integrase [Melioribacteraceae bacterium]